MIRVSRLLSLIAVMWTWSGCEQEHACTLIGCRDGLVMSFDGLIAGSTYQIVVSVVTPTATAPLVTCTAAPGANGDQQLTCDSVDSHTEVGTTLQIHDSTLNQIQVTVSSNGAQLSQQTFTIGYQSVEINGPGCGVCTHADVTVTLP